METIIAFGIILFAIIFVVWRFRKMFKEGKCDCSCCEKECSARKVDEGSKPENNDQA
jgi:hypothetical protein